MFGHGKYWPWSWKINKLYQIKDDLDFFFKRSFTRFDKNLALSKPGSA